MQACKESISERWSSANSIRQQIPNTQVSTGTLFAKKRGSIRRKPKGTAAKWLDKFMSERRWKMVMKTKLGLCLVQEN